MAKLPLRNISVRPFTLDDLRLQFLAGGLKKNHIFTVDGGLNRIADDQAVPGVALYDDRPRRHFGLCATVRDGDHHKPKRRAVHRQSSNDDHQVPPESVHDGGERGVYDRNGNTEPARSAGWTDGNPLNWRRGRGAPSSLNASRRAGASSTVHNG
jgi:hypothetical protein